MKFKDILRKNKIRTLEKGNVDDFIRKPQKLFDVKRSDLDLNDQIFEVLMNSAIRRGDGSLVYEVIKEYKQKISSFIDQNKPIETVFMGFPFKCHNPIETLRRTPDLGELAFLLRLLDINETIKQIYPPGMTFTILAEGNSYSNLFGADAKEIKIYQDRLRDFIDKLNGNSIVSLIDFADICTNFPEFEETKKKHESLLRKFNVTYKKDIEKLMDVMTRSLPVLADIPISDLLKVYNVISNDSIVLNDYQKELKNYLFLGAEDLAISYLAFQKSRSELKIIPKTFPNKLYITTISRPTTYSFHPIHKKTKLFPHHGVPLLTSDKVGICSLKEILENPNLYAAVFCEGDIEDAPFYFLKGSQHVRG